MNEILEDLTISGIKQYHFCKRRWALIYIERQWKENGLTMEGHFMHEVVHDESFTEKRGAVLLSRGIPVRSNRLGIRGICDMVEMVEVPDGVLINGRSGLWSIYPVEYKKGKPDSNGADELQLCVQALCLEEMFSTEISVGYLYYAELRHRVAVRFSEELRREAETTVKEMREIMKRNITPKAKYQPFCRNCSLYDLCQPKLKDSAQAYIKRMLETE